MVLMPAAPAAATVESSGAPLETQSQAIRLADAMVRRLAPPDLAP
jgi:hypothetical protein